MAGALVLGVIAPVVASIVNPGVEENTPPAKTPLVPENITGCTVASLEQNGVPAYVITAVGAAVMVTLVVAVCKGQPLTAAIV